ncbi:VOC family protein [Lacibacter sediminis]|uniref:VOC family protein n=1 Tax=Lacibacter sediminis TaxID=2760713 RepID=A0A7G5XEQ9_9BACT|nr:VOC family protein [Lacibacter sediminis]QNA43962.1 VOC family protein [Lacibacter sediminis]
MLQKLRTVIYRTNDLAAAKSWYISLTGKEPYFDEPFYVGFDINGFELGLDPDMSKTQTGNHSTSYWSVDDLQAAVDKAVSLGAIIIDPAHNVGGTIEVAIVEDPFGNHIGFITGA